MKHPFSMEKSSSTMVELNESETSEVSGGMTKPAITLATFEAGGGYPGIQLPITKMLQESGGGSVTTQAVGEEGGGITATTYALGEEGGGRPIWWY